MDIQGMIKLNSKCHTSIKPSPFFLMMQIRQPVVKVPIEFSEKMNNDDSWVAATGCSRKSSNLFIGKEETEQHGQSCTAFLAAQMVV